jgi:anti-sigma regulatory factor (Ser/Thr protein kinase)
VERAVAQDAAVLVAVGPARAVALSEALGDRAQRVRFADMHRIGRNPARIIPVWEQFVKEHAGAPKLGIGEPVWRARGPAELDECDRHEALLNLAFNDGPQWQLLCPYDLDGLDDAVIEAAQRTHPILARDRDSWPSAAFLDGDDQSDTFAGDLPAPPTDAQELSFTASELGWLRGALGAWASGQSLGSQGCEELVLAANELATNSVMYGGGRGTMTLWRDGESVLCDVRDRGQVAEPLVGRERPAPDAHSGRGVWIANQVCDLVQIRSGPGGTVVRMHKCVS